MKWCDQWQSWVDEDECSIHADLCDDASCDNRGICYCYWLLKEVAG